ncbi:Mur ligase family protein [Saccharospirillum sp.]|uniref:Mur ligase family protein n=1 Tax=Saccharospirillum sp. TaxID=2033801 RepID=UPI0034A07A58
MNILNSRFLRGPNIHRMEPCFVALLDLEGHRTVEVATLQGGAALLGTLMPGRVPPVFLDAPEAARLLARLMFAVQAWAGSPATFCDAVALTPSTPNRYHLLCGYQHEAVVKEALRLSVAFVTAMLNHQPFDFEARLDSLRKLANARAITPEAQALLLAARERGIPVIRLEDDGHCFALGWGVRQQHYQGWPPLPDGSAASLAALFSGNNDGRIPVVAVTGTNGKTTTTRLISHVLRFCGAHTGTTTTQGIYIDGQCVESGDCSGYWSARRVLNDPVVEVATLEIARGGILKRGLAFDRCDVGVVLNVSSDHLGLDGIETLDDMAQVKGLVARCARDAAILNADDPLCVAMRDTLAPDCKPVFFAMDARNQVLLDHVQGGGAGAFLTDDGWLVWCHAGECSQVVKATDLPFTLQGHARHNTANALAALAALCCLGYETAAIARSLTSFVSNAQSNPLRGNLFEVDGVKLIVDYAHNVVAYRALCEMARSINQGAARLLGVITSPGDRRPEDLYATGQVCGQGFDEFVVYEQHPRGRDAGTITREILSGARSVAPDKPMHGEPQIRQALWRGLTMASPGDVLVFTCAGTFEDLVEGVRLKNPAEAERIAHEVFQLHSAPHDRRNDEKRVQ